MQLVDRQFPMKIEAMVIKEYNNTPYVGMAKNGASVNFENKVQKKTFTIHVGMHFHKNKGQLTPQCVHRLPTVHVHVGNHKSTCSRGPQSAVGGLKSQY